MKLIKKNANHPPKTLPMTLVREMGGRDEGNFKCFMKILSHFS